MQQDKTLKSILKLRCQNARTMPAKQVRFKKALMEPPVLPSKVKR